ncbi:MAG: DMT family transporter [Alcanivoracaceae bacterium]|nr:DMT family transporter [Alcanivoracaceae bacterium]
MANNPSRGAVMLIIGELLLAVMAAMIKHLTDQGLSSESMVFFRNLFGLLFLFPILFRSGGLRQLKTQRIGIHLLRAITGVGAMFLFFYTIAHATLAEAVLVKMTAPFFLPLICLIWLGDKVRPQTWWAILLGFIGVVVILRPGSGAFNPVLLLALASAALMGVAKVSIRRMADSEPPRRIVFWFGLFSTLISALPMLWNERWPDQIQLCWLLGIGLIATVAQMCMTHAYQLASPGRIGVYNYTSVIWAVTLGWLFWGETLYFSFLLGTLLIVGAGIWNLRTQRGLP